jgi:uncharacterized MnhB-related membrane protein
MWLILWLCDALLAVTLVWLGWRVLATPDLFKAIVLFITFGLFMALAWVRLQAFDIALAEAAIGAGLTGALFLSTLGQIEQAPRHDATQNQEASERYHDDHTV